jgi:UDP-glucose 4-epimerase
VRVLVTGGAGYIGATTAAALLEAGHEVVVLDDLSNGHRDAVPAGARFVEGDVADPAAVDAALSAPVDACLHFAARIEVGASMEHPEDTFAVNVGGAARLLERLIAHRVERFVLSSTAAVYGTPARIPIGEDTPPDPESPYGESKLAIERMLPWLSQAHGLRWAALRYFNAAGATEGRGERHEPETHLIPRVLDVAAGREEAVKVFGTDYPTADGTAVRDYVHVADLADAHVAALQAVDEGHDQLVCNLGTGIGASVREVVEVARQVTKRRIAVVEEERRAGDPPVLVASQDRARRVLGWVPRRSYLNDIITSAWAEHPAHGAVGA